jgi:hypothetical protein
MGHPAKMIFQTLCLCAAYLLAQLVEIWSAYEYNHPSTSAVTGQWSKKALITRAPLHPRLSKYIGSLRSTDGPL